MSDNNLIEALGVVQNETSSNSTNKLTAINKLQKAIQQKELNNEKLTQEEIDSIYKTMSIFEEIKEHEKSENSRNPRMLNKNYYKLTDPSEERRHSNTDLEWDDGDLACY